MVLFPATALPPKVDTGFAPLICKTSLDEPSGKVSNSLEIIISLLCRELDEEF